MDELVAGFLATFLATLLGVVVAFWLESIAEQRRNDARVIWTVRHWLDATWRNLSRQPLVGSLLWRIEFEGLSIAHVHRALHEVDPRLETWFRHQSARIAQVSGWGNFSKERRERAAIMAHEVDVQLESLLRQWPTRRIRINRVLRSNPTSAARTD